MRGSCARSGGSQGGSLGYGRLWSVFAVSLASIAFEVMLTRYFAIASWAEYGYWVISIAMVGYAFSGVLLSLLRGAALKLGDRAFYILCILLMFAAAGGFYGATINPFNPQQLQNPVLWRSQLVNIGAFYLALFPFFFLAGTFMGLAFTLCQEQIAKLYAADMVGAGLGAALILVLMFVVHPFYLACAVPFFLCAAAMGVLPRRGRIVAGGIAVAVLALCTGWLGMNNKANFCEYKSIYPVLHVQDNRILTEVRAPRGYYLLLDNFTERRDLPLSNNSGLLKLGDPPAAPGLYKDGSRLASLVGTDAYDFSYIEGALSALPYKLRKVSRTLLIGSSGGFRPLEVTHLGCTDFVALESDPVLYGLVHERRGTDAPFGPTQFLHESPQSYLARVREPFEIIDIAEDYQDTGLANKYGLTEEAIRRYLRKLTTNGILSLPVSIREWTVYSDKLASTVAAALRAEGIAESGKHVMVYRTEWAARILVGKSPFTPDDVAALTTFCSDLSFDTSYYPGMDPANITIWNEAPRVTFGGEGSAAQQSAGDPMIEDLQRIFGPNQGSGADSFFDLRPTTDDRPFPQYTFRFSRLKSVLQGIELIPQEGIGFLVNVAVLIQAAFFALVVLLLPLARLGRVRGTRRSVFKGIVYFACLGLGFLFVEIALIEKFSFLLNDSVSAFAVVLTGMLVFSA